MSDVRTVIDETVKQLGFALCGVCEAKPSDRADFFRGWLADGKHGEMDYLARNVAVRVDPEELVEGARAIVCVADSLNSELPDSSSEFRAPSSEFGQVARYAQYSDYHKVLKKRLHKLADRLAEQYPDETFRGCVDTAPLFEREHAARAGLGWIGKHTLLINPREGSHLLLGAIVTTLTIEPDTPEVDHCGTCTRCIDACPTQCITPYSVNASRCISYLTIEHRSAIDPSLHEAMGNWIFGCDVCQDVCPHVRKAKQLSPSPLQEEGRGEGKAQDRVARQEEHAALYEVSPSLNSSLGGRGIEAEPPEFLPAATGYQQLHVSFDLFTILHWTENDRCDAFIGSAMKRAKLDMMQRNALIAAGNVLRNHDVPALRDRIEQLAADDSALPLVQQTARDVLANFNA